MTNGILVYYIRFFFVFKSSYDLVSHVARHVFIATMLQVQTCIQITHYLSYCVSYTYSVGNTLRGVKIPNSNRRDNNACAKNIPWV